MQRSPMLCEIYMTSINPTGSFTPRKDFPYASYKRYRVSGSPGVCSVLTDLIKF